MEIDSLKLTFSQILGNNKSNLEHANEISPNNELRAAADGFETLFVTMMLKSARQAGFEDQLTGGKGVDMAQDIFDMKIAEVTSGQTNFGISQAVYRQFTRPIINQKG